MQKHVAENNKTTQKRIDELEALVWTHFQTFERGHAEAVQQATQRMTTLETTLPETRSAIDDVERELINTVTKRIGELESVYWGHVKRMRSSTPNKQRR